MNKPILYILCGPAGAGKSTWAKYFLESHKACYVSRDEIRFSIIKPEEDYFSHETEVFNCFVQTIANFMIDDNDTIADATHLNMKSRRRLIRAIDNYATIDYNIIFVCFSTPFEVCCARNAQRTDRKRVPDGVMAAMGRNYHEPKKEEDNRCIEIWEVQ